MSTNLSADVSITFVCRLVFIFIFVLVIPVLCISTSDSVRLSVIANFDLVFDLHYYANFHSCLYQQAWLHWYWYESLY